MSKSAKAARKFGRLRNRQPAESRLETFEADFLEEAPVVADRTAPFLVVIALIQRIVAGPPAAGGAVGVANETGREHAFRLQRMRPCAEHQDAVELRPAGDAGGDPRRVPSLGARGL